METYERRCRICGTGFRTRYKDRTCCSKECEEYLVNIKKYGTAIKAGPKKRREMSSLARKNEEARSMGMSYGQYMAWLETQEGRKHGTDKKR